MEELGNQLQKAESKDLGFLIIVREMRWSWTGSTDINIIQGWIDCIEQPLWALSLNP